MKLNWRNGVVTLAAAAILVLGVVACGGGEEAAQPPAETQTPEVVPTTPAAAEPTSTPTPTPTPAPTPPPVGMTRDSPVPVGQTVLVSSGWEITVLDFVPDATQLVLAENQFNDPPETGFRFAMVRVRATNASADDPASLLIDVTLKMVGSRNVAYDTFDPGCGVIPSELDSFTDVFRDGSIEGNECFQASIDETNLVLIVESGFIDDERLFFALQ